ncbi:zinc knuckle domain [Lecanosticta acicola]|uniref:Zinc knuckle domain n=1 Tax=Lecanosticta acicola TaxID=111012 RepID=A0AAI9EDJ8_9PEZI|nr:zinc knuckle domain [Lecanosticta acicola]
MAPQGRQTKTMSSRLAGMKFMQRGNSNNNNNTPESPGDTPAGPPAKKLRLSNGSSIRSPAPPAEQSPASESRSAPDLSKSEQWYLSFQAPAPSTPAAQAPLRIVSAGYSALDAAADREVTKEDEDEQQQEGSEEEVPSKWTAGRKSFGRFNRKLEKQQNPDVSSSSSSSSDENESDEEENDRSSAGELSDDPTGVKALMAQGQKSAAERARAERKAKRKADGAGSARMAGERRKKDVNLNRVAAAAAVNNSRAGGPKPRGSPLSALADMECHRCREKGHMARDCTRKVVPQRSRARLSY